MKKEKSLTAQYVSAAVIHFILLSFTVAAVILTVKNLGSIINRFGNEQFGKIFSQISDADVSLPLYIPIPTYILFGLLIARTDFDKRRTAKIVGLVIFGILLFAVVTLLTLWLTKVNGIRVSDVAVSLLRYVKNGIADKM